eukprot:8451923-Lingulodinium_polyedra.AAC.1
MTAPPGHLSGPASPSPPLCPRLLSRRGWAKEHACNCLDTAIVHWQGRLTPCGQSSLLSFFTARPSERTKEN